jgi:hypothetical protein
MRKLRAPNRMALELAAALAAALLITSAASAANAPKTISSSVCDYASNKPLQMQAEINALMLSLGFTGLPTDQCDQFVASLVKSCNLVVRAGTTCSLDIIATVGLNSGKMSDLGCEVEASTDAVKSCKSTVKTNTKNNQSIAGQTVQLLGANACNTSFAFVMHELCIEGATPP